MLEIKVSPKRTAKVIIGEDSWTLRVPTVLQAEKYQKELKKSDSLSKIVDMLADLGLPKDTCNQLDVMQITEILEGLTTLSKKN